MAFLYAAFLIAGAILATFYYYQPSSPKPSKCPIGNISDLSQEPNSSIEKDKKKSETESYKALYYKVQNLEMFPEILPFARQTLFSLLQQAVLVSRLHDNKLNILNLGDYSPEKLSAFMAAMRNETHVNWSGYQQRRDAGGPPEMFTDREAARKWVKDNAPLQLVDGAWVARVHNVTTPFALRGITKNAWQTYCEELGDGELDKNHCYIYRELCRSVGFEFPDQNDVDFIDPKHGFENDRVWRASAGHLLISLFPNDFLPEILGFNLHYESLAPGTLKAAKELPEFGISGYYFAVHICIDNADSGHSAMAEATINTYIEHVRKTGIMDVREAWKRVQAGFLLSEYLDGDEDLSKYRDAVAEMIHNKAGVAGQVHCTSRARIGGRKLTDWFSKDTLSSVSSSSWKEDFVSALARSKPWVYPGDSERGLLLKELSWKGRMFGAFTHSEVQCLRTWIDVLDNEDSSKVGDKYWKLVGREHNDGKSQSDIIPSDAASAHPTIPPQQQIPATQMTKHEFIPLLPLQTTQVKLNSLLPLWFTHPCILEQVVMSPYRTTRPLGSLVLELLRAESGYMSESSGIAGMDEQRNTGYSPSLTELGLEIVGNNRLPMPTCLKDILHSSSSSADAINFAYAVLGWAARPIENSSFLLGLARAFLDLETYVFCTADLLSGPGYPALKKTIERKQDCFERILSLIKTEPGQVEKFITGYEFGRAELERLLV